MSVCEKCRTGERYLNVWCAWCGTISHIHEHELTQIASGTVIVATCSVCGQKGSWIKAGGSVYPVKVRDLNHLPRTNLEDCRR